jgi:hypothetical protein
VNDWFPELDPPPGGLRDLRARLEATRRPWWPGLLLLAAALLLAILWPRPRTGLQLDAGLAAWVAPPTAPVSVPPGAEATTAIERVPVDIVWYRVAGTAIVERQ